MPGESLADSERTLPSAVSGPNRLTRPLVSSAVFSASIQTKAGCGSACAMAAGARQEQIRPATTIRCMQFFMGSIVNRRGAGGKPDKHTQ